MRLCGSSRRIASCTSFRVEPVSTMSSTSNTCCPAMGAAGVSEISGGESAEVLVTGENLGQVSSQTLASLRAIDAVARHPVVRPLIGFDKQEIVDRAKAIGTYEVSKGPEICDLLGPPRPATHARLDQVLAEESKLPIDRLVASCLEGVEPERFKGNGAAGPHSSGPTNFA